MTPNIEEDGKELGICRCKLDTHNMLYSTCHVHTLIKHANYLDKVITLLY